MIAYFEGSHDPQVRQQVQAWRSETPENEHLFARLHSLWEQDQHARSFSGTFEQTDTEDHDFVAKPFPMGGLMLATRLAAVTLLLIPLYFLFRPKINAIFWPEAGNWITYFNSAHDTQTIHIGQAGQVLLFGDSELRFMLGQEQELYLEGSANFRLDGDETKHIHAGRLHLRASDAEFELIRDAGSTSIAVQAGEVSLLREGRWLPVRTAQSLGFAD
ncbi:MAG: hypothetical protein OHK0039_35500 [Bacteroidia bacterium]